MDEIARFALQALDELQRELGALGENMKICVRKFAVQTVDVG